MEMIVKGVEVMLPDRGGVHYTKEDMCMCFWVTQLLKEFNIRFDFIRQESTFLGSFAEYSPDVRILLERGDGAFKVKTLSPAELAYMLETRGSLDFEHVERESQIRHPWEVQENKFLVKGVYEG